MTAGAKPNWLVTCAAAFLSWAGLDVTGVIEPLGPGRVGRTRWAICSVARSPACGTRTRPRARTIRTCPWRAARFQAQSEPFRWSVQIARQECEPLQTRHVEERDRVTRHRKQSSS